MVLLLLFLQGDLSLDLFLSKISFVCQDHFLGLSGHFDLPITEVY